MQIRIHETVQLGDLIAAAFDEAALAMLKRADPFPPPPPAIADAPEGLDFDFVVNFHPPVAHRRAGR